MSITDTVKRSLAITLALSITTPALAKREPVVFAPTGKWVVSYDEDGCSMLHSYAAGDDKAVVIFRRYAPGSSFLLTLAGDPFRAKGRAKSATLRFGPDEDEIDLLFFSGKLGDNIPAMVFSQSTNGLSQPPEADETWPGKEAILARQRAIQSLEVSKAVRRPVRFELGSMEKPLAAFGKCIDDLVSNWGLDPETQKSLTRRPEAKRSPAKWDIEYPADMLLQGQPAIVNFRLMIDSSGAVQSCHIQRTTRLKEFDDAVCKSIMRRATFEPALDATGQPVASYYVSRVRFQIGDG
ncbi:MAG: energy transducer TonB [Pseudomonadota bacterium]